MRSGGGNKRMVIKVGEKIKRSSNGKVYRVKLIKNGWILLERENESNQVLMKLKDIIFSYEKIKESPH
jgi:hypothetical protein